MQKHSWTMAMLAPNEPGHFPEDAVYKREPTRAQYIALRRFAAAKGRTWKQALRDAWMAGGYDATTGEYINGPLQQLRNTLGPTWLTRFTFKKEAKDAL